MNGKEVKKRWPKFAERHKLNDEDVLFLAGENIKVLRKSPNKDKAVAFGEDPDFQDLHFETRRGPLKKSLRPSEPKGEEKL